MSTIGSQHADRGLARSHHAAVFVLSLVLVAATALIVLFTVTRSAAPAPSSPSTVQVNSHSKHLDPL